MPPDRFAFVLVTRIVARSHPRILAVTSPSRGGLVMPGCKLTGEADDKRQVSHALREQTSLITFGADLVWLGRAMSGKPPEDIVLYYASTALGIVRPEGAVHAWLSWSELLECSPLKAFYGIMLPDGIGHLLPTFALDREPLN